jgi:hypothetical protein
MSAPFSRDPPRSNSQVVPRNLLPLGKDAGVLLYNCRNQRRKSRCSCRIRLKFDSLAKPAECPDHSDRADSLGLFGHGRASFLIAEAFMQNHPDQLTDAMRNRPDGFVVAETRNETTIDDLEDASFTFDGSIGA